MKRETKKVAALLALAVVVSAGVGGVASYHLTMKNNRNYSEDARFDRLFNNENVYRTSYSVGQEPVDFTEAAEKSVHAVVHIKSVQNSRTKVVQELPDFFDYFFGDGRGRQREVQTPPQVGFGSGVIISDDGYIVTNNHVIDGSDEITITLNDKREFKGTLVGTDPVTDLALVKIDADGLVPLPVGDSEQLKVGEWVLAVGNPFNLSSTVTAGIVSAKARNLGGGGKGVNGSIESYIQTDAAVNRGNSGGALVNTRGELVGINAAIYSPTGVYSGYGFAIPTSIMKKVVADIKEYGTVQRAMLGILGGDNNAELAEEKELGTNSGVYVSEVTEGSSADEGGMKADDVIVGFNGRKINSMAELQEAVAMLKPGEKVNVEIMRAGKEKTLKITMKNSDGETKVTKKTVSGKTLGAEFEKVSKEQMKRLDIANGLEVKKLGNGRLKSAGIGEGFVIVKANNVLINSESDLAKVIAAASKSSEKVLFIVGVYPSGRPDYYAVDLSGVN